MLYDIWVDGACSNNGKENSCGGWAYLIMNKYRKIIAKDSGAEKPSSNNRMELIAAIKGLEAFDKINESGFDTCVVHTDSAYIFNCKDQKWYLSWIRNGWKTIDKKPVKNKELWIDLIQYFDKTNIEWRKVRGHAGIEYNEIVDEMAVAARKEIE